MAKDPNKKVKRPKRLLFVLLTIVSAIVIAVTVVGVGVVGQYSGLLNTFINSGARAKNDEAAAASTQTAAVTEEVEGEGVILLKDDGALPLSGTTKVNVLGSTAGNNFSYGGTGSGSGDSSKNVTFYQGLENAGLEPNPDLESYYDEKSERWQEGDNGQLMDEKIGEMRLGIEGLDELIEKLNDIAGD